MTHLAILGGGPAGLGVAFYADRAGLPFELYEGSPDLGGMCRTLRHGDHLYDRGAHRFHDRDPEITRDIVELMGEELVRVEAPSAILDGGRFIDFPPTPLNVMFAYGFREAGRICLDLLRSGLAAPAGGGQLRGFRRQALRRDPRAADPPQLFRQALGTSDRSALARHRDPAAAGNDAAVAAVRAGLPGRQDRAHRRQLPVSARRLRPDRRCARRLAPRRNRSAPASRSRRLECDGGVVRRIRFAGGRTLEVEDRVVSTLPLPLLVRLLGDALPEPAREAASRLRFRHVRLLFLRLDRSRVSGHASIYIPDPAFCVSRIYEPKNRSAAMAPDERDLARRGSAVLPGRRGRAAFGRGVRREGRRRADGSRPPRAAGSPGNAPALHPQRLPRVRERLRRDVGVIQEALALHRRTSRPSAGRAASSTATFTTSCDSARTTCGG